MAATRSIGNLIAPLRFLLFVPIFFAAVPIAWRHMPFEEAVMIGFDLAAGFFLLSCLPLLRHRVEKMRVAAVRNDANRPMLLALTAVVIVVVLVVIASALGATGADRARIARLVILTLGLAWLFSNMVFALHYAHLFYTRGADGKDSGGLDIPATKEPDYWDFVYFSFTLGMTFQTSDVEISSPDMRRVALFHSMLAFVFNIGVLAFTINVLGGR